MAVLLRKAPIVGGVGLAELCVDNGVFCARATYNYDSSTDMEVFAVPKNTTVLYVMTDVLTAFDGASAGQTLTIGDDGWAERFMTTSDAQPYTAGLHSGSGGYKYTSDDTIDVVCNPNSSTVGEMEILCMYLPAPQ